MMVIWLVRTNAICTCRLNEAFHSAMLVREEGNIDILYGWAN
jgi:hypothetical protein